MLSILFFQRLVRIGKMSFFLNIAKEIVRRNGFNDGIAGNAPAFQLDDGPNGSRTAYYEGYELGKESSVTKVIKKASDKFLD